MTQIERAETGGMIVTNLFLCLFDCLFCRVARVFFFLVDANQVHCTCTEYFNARAMMNSGLHVRFPSFYEADLEKQRKTSIDDGARCISTQIWSN